METTPLVDICGHTELSRATMRTIITELLTHKANINTQHNRLKTTPLMRIIGYLKDESIARQLILAGADVTITDRHEQTAFDLIETPTMRETFLEACAINEQAVPTALRIRKNNAHRNAQKSPHTNRRTCNQFQPISTQIKGKISPLMTS